MMLVYTSKRQISFIIAAKSYKRPVIGFFAKALGAIPVERP
jgi:1-acyl-sn-glycerol-3-phosphate acyltransferase